VKFKIDENLPPACAELLRSLGYEAETALDEGLGAVDDPVIADHVRREARVLITLDLDFGDIRLYPPQEYDGIIVMRPTLQGRRTVLQLLQRIVPLFHEEQISGRLWIVQQNRVRIVDYNAE